MDEFVESAQEVEVQQTGINTTVLKVTDCNGAVFVYTNVIISITDADATLRIFFNKQLIAVFKEYAYMRFVQDDAE